MIYNLYLMFANYKSQVLEKENKFKTEKKY